MAIETLPEPTIPVTTPFRPKLGFLTSTPIIAVTSYALSGDEAKARAAGCDGYVTKPFSPRELLAKVREYLPVGKS